MLLERSEILVKEGQEENFAAAMNERGIPLLMSVAGVESVSMGRGIENPDKFMLLLEWKSVEAHTAFTKTPGFNTLLEVMRAFSRRGCIEHFNM